MSSLRDLYGEMILDHSKHPRNKGGFPHANHKADGFNPLCGDRVTLYLDVRNDEIREVRFEGSGCAISTASVSLLTEEIKGKKVGQAQALFKKFHRLVTDAKGSDNGEHDLGKLIVFEGVKEFPVRVKCATLPWHTLMAALGNQAKVVTTEE